MESTFSTFIFLTCIVLEQFLFLQNVHRSGSMARESPHAVSPVSLAMDASASKCIASRYPSIRPSVRPSMCTYIHTERQTHFGDIISIRHIFFGKRGHTYIYDAFITTRLSREKERDLESTRARQRERARARGRGRGRERMRGREVGRGKV